LGYPVGFAILAVPAFLGLTVLLLIQQIYLNPGDFEAGSLEIKGEGAGAVLGLFRCFRANWGWLWGFSLHWL
jgi:hypothetical protein